MSPGIGPGLALTGPLPHRGRVLLRHLLLGLLVLVPSPTPPTPVTYAAPLVGGLHVVRAFDPPTSDYGAGHRGVDLAAPPGAVVLAAAPGVVDFAGPLAGRTVVSVRHADGLRTTYEPLDSVAVRRGQAVIGGAPLGTLAAGHPGCLAPAGDACLHWGALRGADYLDPLSLLETGDIVLLPPVGPP